MGGQVPQKKSWVEQAHAALQVPTPMISIAKMSVPFHTNVWQSFKFSLLYNNDMPCLYHTVHNIISEITL